MIEIRDLIFRYRHADGPVLDRVNAGLKNGTIHVLLGLNGSGKTTLIKLLAGLLQPGEGDIRYDGTSLSSLAIRERAAEIAYVAQQSGRADDFCVKDYLLFGTANQTKFYETPSPDTEKRVTDTAERLGIVRLLDKKLGEISGGERQIVSIAAAIVQNTPYVLLDEPTSALDICNQAMVLSVLKVLAEQEKKTIVLSTHNPNHALYLGADVYLLHDGRIADAGKADEIITPDRLSCVYGDKIRYSKDLPYREISLA